MLTLILFNIVFAIVVWISPGYAADYFTARGDPATQEYLRLVEFAHTSKVMDWILQKRMNNALSDIKYTLERFPNHPKGLQLISSFAHLTKDPALPIPYFDNALRLYPQYALTRAQYGSYLVDIGRLNAGIAELKQALEMDSNLAVGHAWLAKAYAKSGNQSLARQAAEQARSLGYRGEIAGLHLAE